MSDRKPPPMFCPRRRRSPIVEVTRTPEGLPIEARVRGPLTASQAVLDRIMERLRGGRLFCDGTLTMTVDGGTNRNARRLLEMLG